MHGNAAWGAHEMWGRQGLQLGVGELVAQQEGLRALSQVSNWEHGREWGVNLLLSTLLLRHEGCRHEKWCWTLVGRAMRSQLGLARRFCVLVRKWPRSPTHRACC